jgi:toxin CcdB
MKACHWTHGGRSDMPRFDVYRNSGEYAEVTPYLLDVQSDLLQGLEPALSYRFADVIVFPLLAFLTILRPHSK